LRGLPTNHDTQSEPLAIRSIPVRPLIVVDTAAGLRQHLGASGGRSADWDGCPDLSIVGGAAATFSPVSVVSAPPPRFSRKFRGGCRPTPAAVRTF